jgi:hypothetical protein
MRRLNHARPGLGAHHQRLHLLLPNALLLSWPTADSARPTGGLQNARRPRSGKRQGLPLVMVRPLSMGLWMVKFRVVLPENISMTPVCPLLSRGPRLATQPEKQSTRRYGSGFQAGEPARYSHTSSTQPVREGPLWPPSSSMALENPCGKMAGVVFGYPAHCDGQDYRAADGIDGSMHSAA